MQPTLVKLICCVGKPASHGSQVNAKQLTVLYIVTCSLQCSWKERNCLLLRSFNQRTSERILFKFLVNVRLLQVTSISFLLIYYIANTNMVETRISVVGVLRATPKFFVLISFAR
jgi:hypothetical protein